MARSMYSLVSFVLVLAATVAAAPAAGSLPGGESSSSGASVPAPSASDVLAPGPSASISGASASASASAPSQSGSMSLPTSASMPPLSSASGSAALSAPSDPCSAAQSLPPPLSASGSAVTAAPTDSAAPPAPSASQPAGTFRFDPGCSNISVAEIQSIPGWSELESTAQSKWGAQYTVVANDKDYPKIVAQKCQSAKGTDGMALVAKGWVWFQYLAPVNGHYKWALDMDAVLPDENFRMISPQAAGSASDGLGLSTELSASPAVITSLPATQMSASSTVTSVSASRSSGPKHREF